MDGLVQLGRDAQIVIRVSLRAQKDGWPDRLRVNPNALQDRSHFVTSIDALQLLLGCS